VRTVKNLRRASNGIYEVTIAGDDGVTAPFRLSENLVVEYRLVPDRKIDDALFAKLVSELDADKLFEAALRHLSRAPKTAAEMRTFLAGKTADAALADRVYAKLCDRGYVDDLAYAIAYFDYRFGVSREGPHKIRFDLDRKGVFRAYAEEAVAGATPALVERNLAWLFDRKLPALRSQPREKAMRAMKGYLVRKGYDPGVALPYCDSRKADFPFGEDETKKAVADLAKAKKRLAGKELSGPAERQKLMQAMKNKGYAYGTIRRVMEETENDES